ncbi:hypothetical protein I4U23_003965 [Adineta vaga]|nr:hypothetical protein I4U23_003965 [Adineta vaga]
MNNTTTESNKISYWFCQQCGRNFEHGEFYFNCVVCDDYNICNECLIIIHPLHPHRLMQELAYGKEDIFIDRQEKSMADGIEATIAMYHDRYCLGVRDIDTYSWLTYQTIGDRSRNFGEGLREIIEPGGFLGICAGNRPEWIITDFACILQNLISVTMYCLFNDSELTYIINNTKISVIVCDQQMLSKLIRLLSQCPSLHHLICMDPIPQSDQVIYYMGDIEARGVNKQYTAVRVNPNDCSTIIYTSGSSGFPKGAMISHRAYQTTFLQRHCAFRLDPIYFCYEPLAWVTGRFAVLKTFLAGGRTGFSSGNVSLLMEELALVRPTNFSATPAIRNKIYAEYKAALSSTLKEGEILQQFSRLIPTRCKRINVGGAMISSTVLDFIKRCFTHCSVYESYGITECGSVASNNVIRDSIQYRLLSIPEMGYTTDDEPFPRGELLIKNEEMFSGYVNDLEETQAAFTEDGFFRTGDVVEIRLRPNGASYVNLIDRKKNFFKLSQGQYISPEYLQTIYIQSPFIEQIYIHGDLLADSISAVVVPNRDYVQIFASEHHLETLDMNNPHPKLYNAILENLRSIAQKESLRRHEIPSRLIIDFQSFTSENGLLTSTMKPCRPKLAAYYGEQLKQPKTLEQRLKDLLNDKEKDNNFIPSGGDSLSAMRLSHLIENNLGITVPVSILLELNMTFDQLAEIIQDLTFISSASRSTIEKLYHDSELSIDIPIGNKCKDTSKYPTMIFINGTTGFVGAFLLAELLTVYSSECKFVCLIRCKFSKIPLDRIRENLLFHKVWRNDLQERIIPLQGDLEEPYFGLDHPTYQALAEQIDLIFHCGATVNFVLPCSKLYQCNVCGTQEIVRFATYQKTTYVPIHYISTLSVLIPNVSKEVSVDEILPDGLITGYAQSKWAGERLLMKANHLGLPITIYRLGSTWASTETGACNQTDLQTFFFLAMMKSKSYPETMVHINFHGLPVDFSTKSIVYLSQIQSEISGNIYHFQNPNSGVQFDDIIDGMRRCDIHLQSISLEEWRKKLKATDDGNRSLALLVII